MAAFHLILLLVILLFSCIRHTNLLLRWVWELQELPVSLPGFLISSLHSHLRGWDSLLNPFKCSTMFLRKFFPECCVWALSSRMRRIPLGMLLLPLHGDCFPCCFAFPRCGFICWVLSGLAFDGKVSWQSLPHPASSSVPRLQRLP